MSSVRTASLGLVVAAIVASAAAPAQAQDAEKARQLFQQGSKYYDLGQFDKAIEAWQQGYDQKPDPGFLYNIAQAYRQKQDATKAIFFYKGYLRNSPKAHNRAEVEQKIAALQKQANESGTTPSTTPPPGPTTPPPSNGSATAPPPNANTPPPANGATGTPPPEPPPSSGVQPPPVPVDETPTTIAQAAPPPSLLTDRRVDLTAGIGPGFWTSGVNGEAKPSFVLTLGAARMFGAATSRFRFRLGALFGYTFLGANEDKSNVTFLSFLIDPTLDVRLTQSGRWFVDVDFGLGLQMVTGLAARSKLLDPTVPWTVSGAQGMLETRLGAGVGYRLTPEIALFSSLAQMSSSKKDHFYQPIKRVEWLFGLAYRL
jgi:hypothetical protein